MKQKFLLIAILFSLSVAKLNAQQLKGDPWIFQVYNELYGRQPNAWELNIRNYNSGSWNNYGELKDYVKQYQYGLALQHIYVSTVTLQSGNTAAFFNQNYKSIAVDLITNDGGSIIAQGGGNIIAQGGGNIMTNAGGNVISPNGSTLSSLIKGVSFGGRYQVLEAGSTLIPTSGKGALIIR